MAERQAVYQAAFAGLANDQVAGDIVDKCRAMLAEEPDTRDDYERAWLRYLVRYHNLDPNAAEALLDWITHTRAPGFRTVANRCQELMRADADLRPRPEIMERRQQQRRQGRVK